MSKLTARNESLPTQNRQVFNLNSCFIEQVIKNADRICSAEPSGSPSKRKLIHLHSII